VGKEIYFQVLDENGMAVQSMRTGTYVHPGEHLSCRGCHRTNSTTPLTAAPVPLALKRPPSDIKPEPEGSMPLTFARLVRPVLSKNCTPCHAREGKGPTDTDYKTYGRYVTVFVGVGSWNTADTVPGEFGARGSRLGRLLLDSHKDRVSAADKRRLTVWMDANAMKYGALHHQAEQDAGKVVWPLLEVDPGNPQGVERERPIPGRHVAQDSGHPR
jgi:hypothetical protein